MQWQTNPGVGMGPLLLGDTREQVEFYLGSPEQISEYDLAGEATVAWYYWSLGVSAHFDEEDDFRLGLLQVSNPELTIHDERLIGLPEEKLLEILAQPKWGKAEFDLDPNYYNISVDSLGLTFWIEDDEVASVQIRLILDENGDDIWPAH